MMRLSLATRAAGRDRFFAGGEPKTWSKFKGGLRTALFVCGVMAGFLDWLGFITMPPILAPIRLRPALTPPED